MFLDYKAVSKVWSVICYMKPRCQTRWLGSNYHAKNKVLWWRQDKKIVWSWGNFKQTHFRVTDGHWQPEFQLPPPLSIQAMVTFCFIVQWFSPKLQSNCFYRSEAMSMCSKKPMALKYVLDLNYFLPVAIYGLKNGYAWASYFAVHKFHFSRNHVDVTVCVFAVPRGLHVICSSKSSLHIISLNILICCFCEEQIRFCTCLRNTIFFGHIHLLSLLLCYDAWTESNDFRSWLLFNVIEGWTFFYLLISGKRGHWRGFK